MVISIGADHGGLDLKNHLLNYLKELNHEVIDHGCYDYSSVDYPDYAHKVCVDVQEKTACFGVLVCTTGIGMSIAANKHDGIRAALVSNEDASYMTRLHNNSNVLCLSQKYTDVEMAKKILFTFISTQFDGGGRHLRRVNKVTELEK